MTFQKLITIPKSMASKKMIDYLTLGLNVEFSDVGLMIDSSGQDYEISVIMDGDPLPKDICRKMRRAISSFFAGYGGLK